MTEAVKNIPASIRTRLSNEAEKQNKSFTEIIQYYGIERFLFRLSKTAYAEKFVLKGGLLFYCWNTPLRRATRDIDLRGYVQNNKETIEKIAKEICAVAAPEDGLTFDAKSIEVIETQVDADYVGIRVKIVGYLEKAKIHVQVDIGFSDPVTPSAVKMEYPSLLSSMPRIKLKGYLPEAVISEKYHAMVALGRINSRMKDYYDIWLLAKSFEFSRQVLHQAIVNTFKNRSTDLPTERPQALSRGFAIRNQKQWGAFLKKNAIENIAAADFSQIVEVIWDFLALPTGDLPANKTQKPDRWIPGKGWE